MPHRLLLLACFLPTALGAQESKAYFDTPVITLSVDDIPYRLGLDFDGDGDTDVIGINKFDSGYGRAGGTTHELALFQNGSDGRLPLVTEFEWTDSADRLVPSFVTAGNYVGDACDEVFYTDGTLIHVFQWDAAQGALVEIGTNVNAGLALDTTSADFDGDGRENPAVLLADRVQVHVPRPSGVRIVDVPIPACQWTRLLPLDVDGNGTSELLLVGPRKFALRSLRRNPHSAVRPVGAELSIEHEMPAVGDIDGDGDEDAVVFGRENYQVLRNDGGVLRVESPVRGGPATHLADIDQDGDLDGVSCRESESIGFPTNAPSKFELSWNDGSGRFARAYEIEAMGSKGLAAVVDLDLDGDVELVAGRVIYYANGPIRPQPQTELVGDLADFHNVDHDLDGDIDLGFRAGMSFENQGDGSLREHQPRLPELTNPLSYGTGSIPGDFDGDGDGDLLVDKWSGSTYLGAFWLDNVGGGVFQELRFAFMPGAELANINLSRSEIQVVDIDQDGHLDVLIPIDWEGQIRWNDGPAGFSETDFDTQIAAVADLDGDGLLDLVQSLNTFGVRRGLGGRSFGPVQDITGTGSVTFSAIQDRLAIADVTGDGALDIFLINRWHRDVSVLAGTPGTLAFSFDNLSWPYWSEFSSGTANRAFVEDLDLDGVPELVAGPHRSLSSWDAQSFVVLAREGTSWTWSEHMGRLHSLIDVDGDGDLDIVARHPASGRPIGGPSAGARLQFGEGLAGLDVLAPKLGARGPFRVGETVTLQVACGRGGATATLVSGRTRVDWLQGALPIYVDPADPDYTSQALNLAGANDSAGTGTATLSFVVPPGEVGLTTYYQVFVADPAAPGSTSASNGLALTIGAP